MIDFVDSQHRVAGVMSIPTLLGLDPSEIIDGDISMWLGWCIAERPAR